MHTPQPTWFVITRYTCQNNRIDTDKQPDSDSVNTNNSTRCRSLKGWIWVCVAAYELCSDRAANAMNADNTRESADR